LPAVSQDSKPDESAKENTPRAGVNGVGTPACIYCPPADYPEKAKLKRMQGTVVLDIEVTLQGKAKKIILVKGLGEELDKKAIEAVKSWKFRPAKNDTGKPVAVRMQVEITFHLNN